MKIKSKIAALACSLIASTAYATPIESLQEITPRPAGSSIVGLGATLGTGLSYSKDGGKTFTTLCSAMAGIPTVDERGNPDTITPVGFEPAIITHDGRFLVGSFNGLWTDDGTGCGWERVPELVDGAVTAFAYDPLDPKIIYGVTARGGEMNGLFRRNENGEVERVGLQTEDRFYNLRIAVLPGGGLRFYTLGANDKQVPFTTDQNGNIRLFDLDGGIPTNDAGLPLINVQYAPVVFIRYSDDFGETWETFELDLAPGKVIRLEAIDPANPDRLVIAYHGDNVNRGAPAILDAIFVSDDRGQTIEHWFDVASFSGIAFDEDGTVFISDRGEGKGGDPRGLLRAPGLLEDPELIGDYEAWCVAINDGKLEVCQRFDWGTVDRENLEFTKLFSVKEIDTLHSCEGKDGFALCRQELCTSHCKHWEKAPLCMEHYPECAMIQDAGTSEPPTGGSGPQPDGSVALLEDAGMPGGGDDSDGCGCRAIGTERARIDRGGLIVCALASILCLRQRRRARRVSAADRSAAS